MNPSDNKFIDGIKMSFAERPMDYGVCWVVGREYQNGSRDVESVLTPAHGWTRETAELKFKRCLALRNSRAAGLPYEHLIENRPPTKQEQEQGAVSLPLLRYVNGKFNIVQTEPLPASSATSEDLKILEAECWNLGLIGKLMREGRDVFYSFQGEAHFESPSSLEVAVWLRDNGKMLGAASLTPPVDPRVDQVERTSPPSAPQRDY